MRQVVLDTETTGLSPEEGHKIIEIGCLEILNRRTTERTFHHYLNPDREIDAGALEVHGISREQLNKCPRFVEIAPEFIEFIRDAELIIHNAPFDIGFIDHEFAQAGEQWGLLQDYCTVFDTLKHARELHPGQRNGLDALCKRYRIDNRHRALHGALLDAGLLADVYLAMTGGQASLVLEEKADHELASAARGVQGIGTSRAPLPVIRATASERSAHNRRLQQLAAHNGGRCLWLK